ncbi:MAG: SpoIID/LytB domain-containing protein [Spirochaetaceae bacterium]|jgi:SpoIID/LytB domain protein|nr:SpoIID/LytB domain-containing protein [Spirochaetaceae bacterium]
MILRVCNKEFPLFRAGACFLVLFLFFISPVFSKGKKEVPVSPETPIIPPLEAYYAGKIEDAAAVFGSSRAALNEKTQMVVLHWELGEMNNAAELLEALIKEKDLSAEVKNELQLELFYTYCLLGSYGKAAALRSTVESFLQSSDTRTKAEYYFYNALVFEGMGNKGKAAELYKQSLEINKWRPAGWYRLGLLLRESDPKEAEKCLKTCWDQDSAFTDALLPLARLFMARKEWKKAGNYLHTANSRFPNDREISAALAETRRHASVGVDNAVSLIRREIKANPPKVRPSPLYPREGSIRIGLSEKRNLVSIKAGGPYTINTVGNQKFLYTGRGKEQIWIEWTSSGEMTIQNKDKKVLARSSAPFLYKLDSTEDTSIVAGVVNGSPETNRTYRGTLEFQPGPGGITVINIVSMGEYLYAVVPSEMPVSWPAEALKAQAIAARSYAIANLGQFKDRGFDLFGTPHSMAYHGVEVENKKTSEIVDLTCGMILFGGKQPLKAYFSANHGGYSEDCLTLWGYDAYMQAVPDKLIPQRTKLLPLDALYRWIRDTPVSYSNVPKYSYISAYRWEKWVSPAEIRRRLAEDPGEITQIITRGRGISGRIVELEVRGTKGTVSVKGDAIWSAMGGLRSSLFTIRHKLDKNGALEYFVFQGAGYGHGIGMDQHGAAGMASVGLSSAEILRHYYPRSEPGRL